MVKLIFNSQYVIGAFSSMKSNILRTILSLLGIMIGTASLVTILSYGRATSKSISNSFSEGGVDIITITPSRGRNASEIFTPEFTYTLSNIHDGIKAVVPVFASSFKVRKGSELYSAAVVGTTSDFFDFYSLKMDTGSWFTQGDAISVRQICVLGSEVAEELFPNGNAVGQYVKIFRNQSKTYYVAGVLESHDSTLSVQFDKSVFIPCGTFEQKLRKMPNVSIYSVKVKDGYNPTEVADALSLYLDSIVSTDGYSIFSAATLVEMASSAMSSFYSFLSAIAAISLLVGGIGIMNITLVSVAERTREIGIRKALGATPHQIELQFLTEAIILTVLGGVLGVIFGTIISLFICVITKNPLVVSFTSYWIGLSFSVAVGVFFGWYPAFKASRLSPVEALSRD